MGRGNLTNDRLKNSGINEGGGVCEKKFHRGKSDGVN